ncbi:hypothetical protein DEO72_LG4g663 [Vigna unguiculata]|uniref:Uncharacterized protein n=1 Tax=Vigna unguiculata TaxID=3917 RepID=A0A4D6LMB5_VIGUN|nr:hypothetical protein DEO72_LG4g663 [Vigna unguiculata]
MEKNINPYTSLAQAKDPHSSKRGLSLKLHVLTEARLPTKRTVVFASSHLGETSSHGVFQPIIQQPTKNMEKNINPYTSLAQAKDPHSSKRGLSLKLHVLTEARLPTKRTVVFASSHLGETSSHG